MNGFCLTDNQQKRAIEWKSSHECNITKVGVIGGKITYSFTPTSIGTVVMIKCACEKELDISEYENW